MGMHEGGVVAQLARLACPTKSKRRMTANTAHVSSSLIGIAYEPGMYNNRALWLVTVA